MARIKQRDRVKYGLSWPMPQFRDDYAIELALYDSEDLRERGTKTSSPESHLTQAIKMLFNPTDFIFSPEVDRILTGWCHTNSLTIWGPSAMTKSGTTGMIMLMDLLVDPYNTLIRVITKPIGRALQQVFRSVHGMV